MVFGYDDAPEGHCEIVYDGVELDVESGIVGGRAGLGQGFAVSFLLPIPSYPGAELMIRGKDHPGSSWVSFCRGTRGNVQWLTSR